MLSLSNKLSLTTQPVYKFVNKYSVQFDGSDQRIITDGADTVAQPTTYSFWCKTSTTSQNQGVFGHGEYRIGAFHLNWLTDNKPMLYLGTDYFRFWTDITAQDDGEWHHWVVYSDPNDITNSKLYVDGVLQTVDSTTSSGSANAYTESLTIGSDQQVGGNSFEGKIDEFAVYDRELTQAEITRMYNTYYSPNRVANGNFAQIGNEEVTNGDFSQIGSEEVTNGDFSNGSTDWFLGSNVEVVNQEAVLTGNSSNQYLSQTIFSAGTHNGDVLKITYEITENTLVGSGIFRLGDFSGASILASATNLDATVGTHTVYVNVDTSGDANVLDFYIISTNTSGSLKIDNVSVKEVAQDWTVVGNLSFANNKATFAGGGIIQYIVQNNVFTQNKFYKYTFDVVRTSGKIKPLYGIGGSSIVGASPDIDATGTYTITFKNTSNGEKLFFYSGATDNFVGSITNITVKEVGQHWTFGTGWSTDGTKALFTTDGSASSAKLEQVTSFNNGATYKVLFDLIDTNNAGVYVRLAGGGWSSSIAGTGSKELSLVAGSGNDIDIEINDGTKSLSIDNIVVQELKHDATNLMLNHSEYQSANPLITSTKSMEFDGVDDYLTVSDDSSLDFAAGFSVSFWVYPQAADANDRMICKGVTGTGEWMISFGAGQAVRVYTKDGDDVVKDFTSANTLTLNEWAMVTVVVNRTTNYLQVYKNGGNLSESSASWTSGWSNSAALTMGVNSSLAGDFDGRMTEVGIWNRELTSLEVASLYNQGMPTDLLVSRGDYVATGLQGYWKMGDGTNDEYPVIYDQVDPTLGSELVTNGDFSNGTTDWTTGNSGVLSIVDGALVVTGDGGSFASAKQIITGIVGKTYKLTGKVAVVSGSYNVRVETDQPSWLNLFTTSSTDFVNFEAYFVCVNTSIDLRFTIYNAVTTSSDKIKIDDISLKELGGNPATMTNMLEGNITNQYPLTKIRNYYRMGDGILDGYPLIADQTNPSLGSELVTGFTNGTTYPFTTFTTSGNDITSAIVSSAFAGAVSNAISVTSGEIYKVTFDYTKNSGDDLRIVFSSVVTGAGTQISNNELISSSGTYTKYFRITSTTTGYFQMGTGNSGHSLNVSINNVSVKLVNGSPGYMTNMSASDIVEDTPNEPN